MDNTGLYALATLAIVLAVLGMGSFNSDGEFKPAIDHSAPTPTTIEASPGYEELLITPSRSGAYLTEAVFDGAAVDVLVDTGASFTTLRDRDALRAGINPRRNEYTHSFSTANGEVLAARSTVRELELGPVLLRDVTVYIIPDDRLEISLLGMNVLQKFGRMEMTSDGLRLSVVE